MAASRRALLQAAMAAGVLLAQSGGARARSLLSPTLTADDLLRFRAKGQVTLLHMADCHAQLLPVYYREPDTNIGVGAAAGLVPHITDHAFLKHFAIDPGTWQAYALTSAGFEPLARAWGRVGGMDRLATLIKAIREERGRERVLLLDGGDALQGSYTALESKGADMLSVLQALGVDATTGHWEFTLGSDRVKELFGTRAEPKAAPPAFLAGNVVDTDFNEAVFDAWRMFERGGVKIAVIGQAFPYTPIANPRWMIPQWSMGIREGEIRRSVSQARARGADVVVLLSHNGFDVDRKLAGRVEGIDVIFTGHTHDALPVPEIVGRTLLIASGSHGKFLSRLDLDVSNGRIAAYNYSLIPVLSDVIDPDPDMAALVGRIRAPHEAMLGTELARTRTLLYRRDNFHGTLDDLILAAIQEQRDCDLAFSPGFRWGTALLPGQPITWDDIYNATAITYPACYRIEMTGEQIKTILEDVADNLFNPDPYYQQGGDMVRVGGMSFEIDIAQPIGRRIRNMIHLRTDQPIEAGRRYTVGGWGSINQATEGPPIWDVVGGHLKTHREVGFPASGERARNVPHVIRPL
jgi:sulfur-oxidizing protein SoxB